MLHAGLRREKLRSAGREGVMLACSSSEVLKSSQKLLLLLLLFPNAGLSALVGRLPKFSKVIRVTQQPM
jgi:hypothetical protein